MMNGMSGGSAVLGVSEAQLQERVNMKGKRYNMPGKGRSKYKKKGGE